MPADDSWRIATSEADGKPLIFRIRNHAPPFARKEAFPHLLAIQWKYDSPSQQGMPSEETALRMSQLEDLLNSEFEREQQAFLSAIVTGNGIREWQWYAQDPQQVMDLVNQTLGELEPFPIEFSFHDDPEWEAYTSILKASDG